jgi:Mn-dependent DtxR family transcriptional regulator
LKVHESAENYLETILVLSLKGGRVRSIDIVNELEYSKPSVSIAMKNLRTKGYIIKDSDGYITLTEKGRKIADKMYERHVAISDWLIFLGVDKKTAVQDACKMEHAMSEKSFSAIKNHIESLITISRGDNHNKVRSVNNRPAENS